MLRFSRRFGSHSGIGALATAINEGDAGRARSAFEAFDDVLLRAPSPTAIATLAIFGREMPKTSPVFWFMMQIAMLAGFLTAYPINIWLVNKGIKEEM